MPNQRGEDADGCLVIERDLFLGIDPGGSGSFALIHKNGLLVDASAMPETMKDIADYLKEFAPRIQMALIEAVHSMPDQGVASSFTFGQNVGALHMGLVAHGIPFEFVQPRAWQQPLGLIRLTKDETITQKKNRHKARAQELFPSKKVIHAIADGMLIAETCRRKYS